MKYRKKPVVIEAIQYVVTKEIPCKFGIHKETNSMEIAQWMNTVLHGTNDHLIIETLEGDMRASIGDYIIKGVSGEFYPCKPDIFEKTYERID